MKLRKLHIEDYKMFKDFDISFVDENDEALPIVVLAGVNGSGKTTLLECLCLEYISEQEVHIHDLDKYNEITFLLSNNKEEITYIEENLSTLSKYYQEKSRNEELLEHQGAIFSKSEYYDNIIYFSINTSIKNIKKLLPKYIEKMIFDKGVAPFDSYKKVTEYMNEILKELKVEIEFDSRDGEGNLFFRNKSGGDKFSIDELSTGEKTLLSKVLFLYLDNIKDKVILIDEPELSLHPSWQNKVLKIYENFAKQNNCQIIIATHSPHIIASADNKYIRFLEKDKKGNITVINDVQAYGRDIEWVLQQMGVTDTRLPKITKRFDEIQELINNQEFDKADDELDKLEYVIGDNDKDILALRNDLAFERMDFEEDN